MSKNSQQRTGIDSFLTAKKLFNRERPPATKMTHKKRQESLQIQKNALQNKNKKNKFQYNLLSDLKKQETSSQPQYMNKLDDFQNNEIRDEYLDQNVFQEKFDDFSPKNKFINNLNAKKLENGKVVETQIYDRQVELQNPPFQKPQNTWQSMVIKTSRRYFETCRSEALDYISKILKILQTNQVMLNNQLATIRKSIIQNNNYHIKQLKQYFYEIIDKIVRYWQEYSLKEYEKKEVNYLGELFELSTQLEERQKQMKVYQRQIEDEQNWKYCASDLLITNYEQEVIQLSKMCKQCVYQSNQKAKKWMMVESQRFKEKIEGLKQDQILEIFKQRIMNELKEDKKFKDKINYHAEMENEKNTKNERKQIFHSQKEKKSPAFYGLSNQEVSQLDFYSHFKT